MQKRKSEVKAKTKAKVVKEVTYCKLPGCQVKWNYDWGRPKSYCTDAHKLLHWRMKKAEAKGKIYHVGGRRTAKAKGVKRKGT